MGRISILDKTGDTRVEWNNTLPAEVDNAERVFNELVTGGYLAFGLVASGERTPMRVFDRDQEDILMFPMLEGG